MLILRLKVSQGFLGSFYILTFLVSSSGIDCFKCVSINGSNPSCEDPFHNNYTLDILERPCMGGRKGRNGLFPASSCTKVAGSYGIYTRLFFNDICILLEFNCKLYTTDIVFFNF